MKTLGQLLAGLVPNLPDPADADAPIAHVTSDSHAVKPGTLFVAVRGTREDGHRYLAQAQQQGAAALVGELPPPAHHAAPYVQVSDSRYALARIAAEFYGNPSHAMKVIGVTGTSGKTTTTYLLESILKFAGHRVGVIGTVNYRLDAKVLPSTHTTPGPVELQQLLAEMKSAGATAVVMEVSSHALKQHRTAGIAFDGVVFTNLSREHLDFHPDMEDYFRSKAILFRESIEYSIGAGKHPVGAVNVDDEYGRRLLLEHAAGFQVLGFGFQSGAGLSVAVDGIRGVVGGVQVESPLIGRFNGSNLLSAIALAEGLGIKPSVIAQGIAAMKNVPGRVERVPNAKGIHVLVDYAHKPDALEKVLRTLREARGAHKLITVFGCGGDRDREKRPVMGRLAVELSDWVVITSDNPRTEDPGAIIAEIVKGVTGFTNFEVEPDRKKAIYSAIRRARLGDLVLIAGKGHEDYQIIGTKKTHFDDREVAAEALLLDTGF